MPSLIATLFLLSAPALAQTVGGSSEMLYQFDGAYGFINFGMEVSDAGDLNGDGFADVIVGAPRAFTQGGLYSGAAYAYSGANGLLLYEWAAVGSGDFFGGSVSGAGDLNGDGFDDVIVGAPAANPGGLSSAGSVYAYSGADGSLLYQWDGENWWDSFGSSVSDAGDVNGDGFADVIVGASTAANGGAWSKGAAYVYSGADGSQLYKWAGLDRNDSFGISVARAGDVNGDGVVDVIVGAFETDAGGQWDTGSAYVYSGADGSLLYQWDGGAARDYFGNSVDGVGDVNGDGFADVVIGSYLAERGGQSRTGSAYVYSGANGALIYQWHGSTSGDRFGKSVASAGDVNGDGVSDVIIGANLASPRGQSRSGSAYVYSGTDGLLLHQWRLAIAGENSGQSVSGAGDVNGDGFDDVIVGAFLSEVGGQSWAGSAYIFSSHPLLTANVSSISASAGGLLKLSLNFLDNAASLDYIILMSASGTGPVQYGVDIPLSFDSYLVNSVAGVYPFSITSNMQGTLDASGDSSAQVYFPAGAYNFAVGRTFWLAAVALPTGRLPAYSSVAVAIELVP